MSDEPRGISVSARKMYRVGAGETRFTEPGEHPMSAEEKYQTTFEEIDHRLSIQMNNLVADLAVVFTPLVEGLAKIGNSPEWINLMEMLAREQSDTDAGRSAAEFLRSRGKGNQSDMKAEARLHSREDLAQKRRELRRRKGRL